MTASETEPGKASRSGSLLSLAPRQSGEVRTAPSGRSAAKVANARPSARRKAAPLPNPMLAALARSSEPFAKAEPKPPVAESEAEAATATRREGAPFDAAMGENMTRKPPPPIDAPPEAAVPQMAAAEEIPAPAVAVAPAEQRSLDNETALDATSSDHGPETAKGLVARLRRQFTQGIPEGRSESGGASGLSDGGMPGPEPVRSRLDELRFRLREFRAELLARPARRKQR